MVLAPPVLHDGLDLRRDCPTTKHFMNWKDRKDILKKEQLPGAGLKTLPAIAVDQNTASRTKRGEPNL